MANRHRTTLRAAYEIPAAIRPFPMSSIVSREKVEKVVNPPQSPVFKNNMLMGPASLKCSDQAVIIPIINAPEKFISSVAAGKLMKEKNGIKFIA